MEEEVVNKKTEEGKKKKRTSLKSILGGDILATDFFRRQTKLMEKSRQSRIEDYISSKESDLQTSTNPPYLIK